MVFNVNPLQAMGEMAQGLNADLNTAVTLLRRTGTELDKKNINVVQSSSITAQDIVKLTVYQGKKDKNSWAVTWAVDGQDAGLMTLRLKGFIDALISEKTMLALVASAEIKTRDADIKRLKKEIETLISQKTELEKSEKNLDEKLRLANKSLTEKSSRITALEQELATKCVALARLEEENPRLTQRIEDLTTANAALRAELDAVTLAKTELNDLFQKAVENEGKLTATVEHLSQENKNTQQSLQALSVEKGQLQERTLSLEEQLEEKKGRVLSLGFQLVEAQTKLTTEKEKREREFSRAEGLAIKSAEEKIKMDRLQFRHNVMLLISVLISAIWVGHLTMYKTGDHHVGPK